MVLSSWPILTELFCHPCLPPGMLLSFIHTLLISLSLPAGLIFFFHPIAFNVSVFSHFSRVFWTAQSFTFVIIKAVKLWLFVSKACSCNLLMGYLCAKLLTSLLYLICFCSFLDFKFFFCLSNLVFWLVSIQKIGFNFFFFYLLF